MVAGPPLRGSKVTPFHSDGRGRPIPRQAVVVPGLRPCWPLPLRWRRDACFVPVPKSQLCAGGSRALGLEREWAWGVGRGWAGGWAWRATFGGESSPAGAIGQETPQNCAVRRDSRPYQSPTGEFGQVDQGWRRFVVDTATHWRFSRDLPAAPPGHAGLGWSGLSRFRRACYTRLRPRHSGRQGRIRLEAQDTALSRRRSPVRIRYAVPLPPTISGSSRSDCTPDVVVFTRSNMSGSPYWSPYGGRCAPRRCAEERVEAGQ